MTEHKHPGGSEAEKADDDNANEMHVVPIDQVHEYLGNPRRDPFDVRTLQFVLSLIPRKSRLKFVK